MNSSPRRRLSFGPFRLDPVTRVVEREGTPVPLGSRALDILLVLTERAGQVVGHRELAQRVWRGMVVEPGTLRVHIAGLRKALGEGESRYIANVPGQGYCFVAPIHVIDPEAAAAAEAVERVEAAAPPRHNLPNPLSHFIGREKEIRQLVGLLADRRLMTLTGSGGCGKTRLALRVAADVLGDFPDGAWLVELAPLGDPALVVQTVANALCVKEQRDRPLVDAVVECLATRRLLLVLDNAEHLVEPCAMLAELLLSRCAGLKILATSREPLGVGGELTYRVPSLTLPEAHDETVEAVLACEAARLFVERARLHRPDFEITSANVGALTSVCRRLDGIALAIELAAPRLRILSIEELDRHLDDRFGILTGWHRTALPRHRTLRSLIDWSYDLLGPPERVLLRRAAVFAGGLTAESAACVCTGDSVHRDDVLDVLTSLTDKSLLGVEASAGETRFGMLETMRDYAWARLRESGEEEALRLRHAAYFLALAERLDGAQADAQRREMLDRLDGELDNVRAALSWGEATAAHSTLGLRLAGKLDQFWLMRGHFNEGSGWLARLFASTPPADETEDHAIAHHTAGILAYRQSNNAQAAAHFQQALAIFERLGQRPFTARTLGNLGNVALHDDRPAARRYYEQALAIARELGDRRSIVRGLHCLGLLARDLGDVAAAQALFDEGIGVARGLGDWSPAALLAELGLVRQQQGNLAQARALFLEALEAERGIGNRPGVAAVLTCLGDVTREAGDLAVAKAHLAEALAIDQAMNDGREITSTLEAFASLCVALDDPTRAARLLGCVQRLREGFGVRSMEFSFERLRFEARAAAARAGLQNEAAFEQAWLEGRSMDLAEAVRQALGI